MTTDEALEALDHSDEIIFDCAEEDAVALQALVHARLDGVTADGLPVSGSRLEQLRPVADMIAAAATANDGPVDEGDYDGMVMRVEVLLDDEQQILDTLRQILTALHEIGIGVTDVA